MNKVILIIFIVSWGLSIHAQNTLRGHIVDDNNISIVDASVYLKQFGTYQFTDNNGYFFFNGMSNDSISLIINYLGCQQIDTSFFYDENEMYVFKLKTSNIIDQVLVKASALIKRKTATLISLEKINNTTVLFGEPDIFKTAQMLPGVNFGVEGTSDYVVRGGNVGENLILIDGIPVYVSSHLLGLLSPINNDVVKEIEFYKSGFPAQYSNKLSSVIDITTKSHQDIRNNASFNIGILSSSLFMSKKLGDKTSFVFSGRASYIDLLAKLYYLFSKGNEVAPGFNDFFLRTNYEWNEKNELSLTLLRSNDRFINASEEESEQVFRSNKESNRWNNSLINLGHTFKGTALEWKNSIAYSSYNYDVHYLGLYYTPQDSAREEYNYDTKNNLLLIKSDLQLKLTESLLLKLGTAYTTRNINLSENDFLTPIDATNMTGQYFENYLSLNVESPRTSSFIGLHVTSLPNVNYKTYLEPRVYLDYRFQSSKIFASYSTVNQVDHLIANRTFGNYLKIWLLADGNTIDLAKSHQYSIGYNYSLSNLELNLELYWKERSNLVHPKEGDQVFITSRNINNLLNDGNGRSYGLELSADYRFGASHKLSMSYSLSRSILQFDQLNKGASFDDYFDRRHSIKLNYNVALSNKWSLYSSFVYLSGTPFTAVESIFPAESYDLDSGAIGGAIPPNTLFYFESINNQRLPAYHRVDISARKFVKFRKRNAEMSFGAYNVYARRNPLFIQFSNEVSANISPGQPVQISKVNYELVSYFNFIPFISCKIKFQ